MNTWSVFVGKVYQLQKQIREKGKEMYERTGKVERMDILFIFPSP